MWQWRSIICCINVFLLGVHGQDVITNPETTLEKGTRGMLSCRVNSEVSVGAILWNKGPTYSESKNIVQLDTRYNIGYRSGPGYTEGSFNMSNDYSLVIYDVEVGNKGRYFCIAIDEDKTTVWNSTDVDVFGKPLNVASLICKRPKTP